MFCVTLLMNTLVTKVSRGQILFCQLVQIWYKITPHTAYIRNLVTFKSQVTATSLENLVDENTVTTIPKLLSGVFKM